MRVSFFAVFFTSLSLHSSAFAQGPGSPVTEAALAEQAREAQLNSETPTSADTTRTDTATDDESEDSPTPMLIEMDGMHFCSFYLTDFPKTCNENIGKDTTVEMSLTPQNPNSKREWKLRLYFGNGNTSYDPTTMKIQTSRIDATLTGVKGVQRTGYQYFEVWKGPAKDAFRWIDEPTNNLKIVFDKNNHQFFLSINHPKVIYANETSAPGLNNGGTVHVKGTVDGVYHDENMPLNPQFDGYNTQPGELNITKFENSWMFMQWEAGYGYAIPLLKSRRAGSIVLTPQIQVGVYTGYEDSAIMKKGAYWDASTYEDSKTRVMGVSVTPAVRAEWRGPKDRIGAYVEVRRSYAEMKYPFLDGTIEHANNYSSITLGISATIPSTIFKRKTK